MCFTYYITLKNSQENTCISFLGLTEFIIEQFKAAASDAWRKANIFNSDFFREENCYN